MRDGIGELAVLSVKASVSEADPLPPPEPSLYFHRALGVA